MRICLLTGGGYPYRRDALGGWCRTLVEGLDQVAFDLLTIVDREPPGAPAYPLPRNVAWARAVLVAPEAKRKAEPDKDATAAAVLLCRGLLGEPGHADQMFAEGLRRLAGAADSAPAGAAGSAHAGAAGSARAGAAGSPWAGAAGSPQAGAGRVPRTGTAGSPLAGVPLADVLVDAWRAGRAVESEERLPLPRLSLRDARTAATLLRHAVRVLSVDVPAADLVHCVGGTTPLLAALGGRWRTGTPLLLTEARGVVARARPAEERLSPAVRTVLRRFRRSVARAGYAEAGLIAPLSGYHHGWALRHGARPSRLVQVPAGVDPIEHPGVPDDADPAIVWAGSGGPDSGLTPLLAAFGTVVAHVPGTVLHLVGVTTAHEDHCAEQVERTGLGRAIRMHPLPADRSDRYAAGHIVVHVPGPADPPYRLIEAMMSGRAVVAVDLGPVAETLGEAGVLVPPNDPVALAEACIALVRAPGRRRALGEAARRRALLHYTTDRVVRAYGALYTDLAGPPPAPAYEMALSVPAPRAEMPATMRWLIREDR
jgi:glycosyltransferase involved in cell wall biosynthesis